jgi:hypothetical protein
MQNTVFCCLLMDLYKGNYQASPPPTLLTNNIEIKYASSNGEKGCEADTY